MKLKKVFPYIVAAIAIAALVYTQTSGQSPKSFNTPVPVVVPTDTSEEVESWIITSMEIGPDTDQIVASHTDVINACTSEQHVTYGCEAATEGQVSYIVNIELLAGTDKAFVTAASISPELQGEIKQSHGNSVERQWITPLGVKETVVVTQYNVFRSGYGLAENSMGQVLSGNFSYFTGVCTITVEVIERVPCVETAPTAPVLQNTPIVPTQQPTAQVQTTPVTTSMCPIFADVQTERISDGGCKLYFVSSRGEITGPVPDGYRAIYWDGKNTQYANEGETIRTGEATFYPTTSSSSRTNSALVETGNSNPNQPATDFDFTIGQDQVALVYGYQVSWPEAGLNAGGNGCDFVVLPTGNYNDIRVLDGEYNIFDLPSTNQVQSIESLVSQRVDQQVSYGCPSSLNHILIWNDDHSQETWLQYSN